MKKFLILIDTSGSLYDEKSIEFLKKLSQKQALNVYAHTFTTHISDNIFGQNEINFSGGGGTDIKVSLSEALNKYPDMNHVVLISDFYDCPLSKKEASQYSDIEFTFINLMEIFATEQVEFNNLKEVKNFGENLSQVNFLPLNDFFDFIESNFLHNTEKEILETNLSTKNLQKKSKKLKV